MTKTVTKPSLASYFTATRLRTDKWQDVKTLAAEWVESEKPTKTLIKTLTETLHELALIESYFCYPGVRIVQRLMAYFEANERHEMSMLASFVVRMLVSHAYRVYLDENEPWPDPQNPDRLPQPTLMLDERPYFEVLVVDDLPEDEVDKLRSMLRDFQTDDDEFVYDLVVVPSFEDALIATSLNFHIQSVVIRYGFPIESKNTFPFFDPTQSLHHMSRKEDAEIGIELGLALNRLRPNLDLFLVTDAPIEKFAGKTGQKFRRVFFRQEDYRELHLSILKGIRARYATPFFTALKTYSARPTGVFHALPIARGKSVSKSHWIREMEDFFGPRVFMAETSATTAGLDSLLQPVGSLKDAQTAAARAFGAKRSFFVTNGTSTANKIVLQAISGPGDIVMATRDCHQSHHYGMVLTGATPLYMNPYPIADYSFYGGVPLREMKRHLLNLRDQGQLHRVKVLLLTNCTFDGIVYNPEQVMEEMLAIHPDLIFIWDEAWFAFAYFTPIYRQRTGMAAAKSLQEKFASEDYRHKYKKWKHAFDANPDPDKWMGRLKADPDRAKIRVYVTQSTHKTLTSFRQGSMIHIYDEEFERSVEESFHQAYLTHTSTSANYPILASLDLGRRQVEFEGYELVQNAIQLALTLRERLRNHKSISKYFDLLTTGDLIPAEFRQSGFASYREARTNWSLMDKSWLQDEFCLDPTRLTLYVGRSGIEGTTYKKKLIEEHDIQVNKTTRNTILFMTHIGTTRGAVAHLMEVLAQMAQETDERNDQLNPHKAAVVQKSILRLTSNPPLLPNFSDFHPAFKDADDAHLNVGNMRRAFFLSANENRITYLPLSEIKLAMATGSTLVSANFVTPYPPGFPVLVPGQIISEEILEFLMAVDVNEIHGYNPEMGLRLMQDDLLETR
ncbi:MAG: ornithine decarboxylase [Acidobacteria bacterium]|nr:ornithine decarboxylase [Acidobacteriota bacterium]